MKIKKFLNKVIDVIDDELKKQNVWDAVEIADNGRQTGFTLKHDKYGKVPGYAFNIVNLFTDFQEENTSFKEFKKSKEFKAFKARAIDTLMAFIRAKEDTENAPCVVSEGICQADENTSNGFAPANIVPASALTCPSCGSTHLHKRGTQNNKQRYRCVDCTKWFSM